MLAYVYGVVPISLCRSGGCGVSAGNGKGVRIEFDDENDMNAGSGAAATGKLQHPHSPQRHTLTPRSNLVFMPKSANNTICFLLTDTLFCPNEICCRFRRCQVSFPRNTLFTLFLFAVVRLKVHCCFRSLTSLEFHPKHLMFFCRYYISCRHQEQPQYR